MKKQLKGDFRLRSRVSRLVKVLGLAVLTVSNAAWAQEPETGNPVVLCSAPGSDSTTTTSALSCGVPGGAPVPVNMQFGTSATLPLTNVLAPNAPQLPTDVFVSISSGAFGLRQFVAISGNILTVSLNAVATGTAATVPVGTVAPPGTLINQIRIRIHNVVVTNSPATMLFSGVVLAAAEDGTDGTAPLSPDLFGALEGRAAAVSLAFNSPLSFPLLGTTGATGATGTGTGDDDTPTMAPATTVGVLVAGSFAFNSPTGFAIVGFPTGTTPGGGTPPPSGDVVIALAPVPNQTVNRTIQLDASGSHGPENGPVTFRWDVPGGPPASITGGDTATPSIQFTSGGIYQIRLTVTAANGQTASVTIPVTFLSFPL